MMNWISFFNDLLKLFEASNIYLMKYGLNSEKYWLWFESSMEKIRERYDNDLATKILITIFSYQNDQLTKSLKEEIKK